MLLTTMRTKAKYLPISTDAEDQWRYKLKLHRCIQDDDISKLPCLIPFIKFPNSSDSGHRSVIVALPNIQRASLKIFHKFKYFHILIKIYRYF